MKHIQFITPALALLAACSWAKAAPITTPEIAYSQDGIHFRSIPALAEPLAVEHFYRKTKAHTAPGFGTPANTDTVAVYFDKNDDTLSLMLVTGTKGENSGSTPMHMDGLPAAVTVFLSKSTNSVQRNVGAGTASATLDSTGGVAGISFTGLEQGDFTIDLAIQAPDPDIKWRLATGSGRKITFEPLNPSSPLVLESIPTGPLRHRPFAAGSSNTSGDGSGSGGTTTGPGTTAVPEPTSLGLVAFAALGLLSRPRRRR